MAVKKKYPYNENKNFGYTKFDKLVTGWKIESMTINDLPIPDSLIFAPATIRFSMCKLCKNNKYTYNMSFGVLVSFDVSEEGDWKFENHKTKINFNHVEPTSVYGVGLGSSTPTRNYTYDILRLELQHLWLKGIQPNGDVWELHYKH